MVNTKRLQCDKSFESEDFDDEESEENDENQPPGATPDVRPRDYGKVIAENFLQYQVSVEEVSSGLFHIQYFKSQLGKYIINKGDIDFYERGDLCVVAAKVDRRS